MTGRDWAGQRAMAWVIDDAPVPPNLFPVLMVIARRCDEHGRGSRQSWETLVEKTGKSRAQVARDVSDLRELGLLSLGDQELSAHLPAGRRPIVYDVPLDVKGLKPQKPPRKGTRLMGETGITHETSRGLTHETSTRLTHETQTKPLKNPKNKPSLSAQDPHEAAAVVPQPRSREREEVSEDQTPKLMTVEHRLIAKRGVTGDSIGYVEGWIESSLSINGIGWWITADRNGTLDAHIADALKAEANDPYQPGKATTPCIRCDGQGQDWCGDYFTTNPCLACHGSGEALESGDRRCPKHKHEPVACRLCRTDRRTSASYIEQVNHQKRTSERGDFRPRRSNLHVPHLDREDISAYKTSRLYPDEIRSPADQRVADGAILYAKYKAQER